MKIKNVFTIYKPLGISPLDAINIFKKKNKEFLDIKMTYAGRLDPMARGLLLIIAGEELKNFHNYLNLDKRYEAVILFSFKSDTYDILGIADFLPIKKENKKIYNELKKIEGKFSFKLPPFSAYKIKGKPLFQWALEDKLDEIEIPEKNVKINKVNVTGFKKIKGKNLLNLILRKINKVNGNFRQKQVKESWNYCLTDKKDKSFLMVKVVFDCSSGTYIRKITDHIGEKLGGGAVLLDLKRTKIGKFKL